MGGGSTTSSDTTTNQINQIPAWISDAGQQNYAYAQKVAQQPLQQYQGQMVADIAPQTQQAWDVAANSGNVGADQYNAATAGYTNALSQTPMNLTASQAQAAPWLTPGQASTAQTTAAPWVAPAYGTLAPAVTAAQAKTAQAAAAQQAALAASTKASTANLSQLSNTNLQPYMNPYTQSVIDKTLPIMNQSLQQQQNAIQNQANSANAFGGSRQAINQGVLGAQGAQSEAQMAAQLNNQNYMQAQQAGMFDVGQANQMGEFNANQLNQVGMYNQGQANQVGMFNAGQGNQVNLANAQMANQANQFNAGQSNQVNLADMAAANAMSQFNAGAANNMRQFDTSQLNTVGMANTAQANAQAQFNTGAANQMRQFDTTALNNMAQFNTGQTNDIAKANQAAQQAKINSDIAASSGLTTTGDSMNKANVANYNLLQSAGAGQSMQAQNEINSQMAKFNQAQNYPQQQLAILEGALNMSPHDTSQSGQANTQTTTPTDWASLIKGGADAAASLLPMSDRSMKTDVTKLGKDPKTGLQMHAYRYKGDPKSYPKVVGPMAQEVQEKYPDKARRVGGKLTVSPDVMSAAGVQGFAAGTPFVGPSLAAFVPPSSPGVAKGISAMSAFRPPTRMPRGLGVPRMQKFAEGTDDVWGKIAKGAGDTVPAMLTPGEAVLNRHAAQQLGRGNIAALNAAAPMGIAGALANLKRRPKIAGGLSG